MENTNDWEFMKNSVRDVIKGCAEIMEDENGEVGEDHCDLIKAVPVLWRGRKPDWQGSWREFWVRCQCSWVPMIYSKILEKNGNLKMGQKLWKLLGFEPGFLKIGVTAAVLKTDGTSPVSRDDWIIAQTRGSRDKRCGWTNANGRGSSWQVEVLDLRMTSEITEMSGI